MEMMLLFLVIVPIVLGLICMTVISKIRIFQETVAIFVSVLAVGVCFGLFLKSDLVWDLNYVVLLRLDALSRFVLLFSNLFGFLIIFYSLRYFKNKTGSYFGAFLVSMGAASGVILSGHLLIFLVCWGVLGITLYLLVMNGEQDASYAAKKSLIMIGVVMRC